MNENNKFNRSNLCLYIYLILFLLLFDRKGRKFDLYIIIFSIVIIKINRLIKHLKIKLNIILYGVDYFVLVFI